MLFTDSSHNQQTRYSVPWPRQAGNPLQHIRVLALHTNEQELSIHFVQVSINNY